MPACPENRRRCREEWAIKIFRHSHSEDTRGPNDHMRVAREIEKQQESKSYPEEPNIYAAPTAFDLIESRDDARTRRPTGSQDLSQQKLNREAMGQRKAARRDVLPSNGSRLAELRQHAGQAANGARDNRGPEGHVEAKLHQ